MNSISKNKWFACGLLAVAAICLALGATFVVAANSERLKPKPMLETIPDNAVRAIESANSLSTAFRTVADHLLPSVVAIENRPAMVQTPSVHHMQPSGSPFSGDNPLKGTPFEDMFREFSFPSQPGQRLQPKGFSQRMPRSAGIGSGVIIDSEGIILTNNHVVAGGGEVTVRTHDGREFVASDVWTDPQTDVAVVKIEGAENLIPAVLGDSDNVEIGDWVIALGQPFGLESTVTAGIISAKHRGIGITPRENFLQTDAAINPGNSGGPLVNLAGEVIGINTAISSRGGGNDGIGFAVPSNLAHWVSNQLRDGGEVRRAYLGIGIQPITQALAGELGVDPRSGVLVTEVHEGTPAETMKLESGDVIVRFNGQDVKTPQALQLAVERTPIGEKVPVQIIRNGSVVTMTYTGTQATGKFAFTSANAGSHSKSEKMKGLGMEVAELTEDVADKLGLDDAEGLIITAVKRDSAADRSGLESGMVIVAVDRTRVTSVKQFRNAIEDSDADEDILLLIRTAKGSRFVVVKR